MIPPRPGHPDYQLYRQVAGATDDDWVFSIHWGKARDWKLDAIESCNLRAQQYESRLRHLNAALKDLSQAIKEESEEQND